MFLVFLLSHWGHGTFHVFTLHLHIDLDLDRLLLSAFGFGFDGGSPLYPFFFWPKNMSFSENCLRGLDGVKQKEDHPHTSR